VQVRASWLQVLAGITILVLVAHWADGSQRVVKTETVQQAFERQRLSTVVLVGPHGCPATLEAGSRARLLALLNACAPGAPYAKHLDGLIVDRASTGAPGRKGWLLAAYILDSAAEAKKAKAPTGMAGSVFPLQFRARNVIVFLQPRGKQYATQVEAALATLG